MLHREDQALSGTVLLGENRDSRHQECVSVTPRASSSLQSSPKQPLSLLFWVCWEWSGAGGDVLPPSAFLAGTQGCVEQQPCNAVRQDWRKLIKKTAQISPAWRGSACQGSPQHGTGLHWGATCAMKWFPPAQSWHQLLGKPEAAGSFGSPLPLPSR